jgi:maltooligosyltrehalose trehalohydrolase
VSESHSAWRLRFGANVRDGGVEFRVWAPRAQSMAVRLFPSAAQRIDAANVGRDTQLVPEGNGEFAAFVEGAIEGTDYQYVLNGQTPRPDPVSRWQPHGVHAPSRILNPDSFQWTDQQWRGIPLANLIIYELHTGIFTPERTFAAVIGRLPYLKDLGITAIEIMPVAEFAGNRGWGYDGVDLYAPHSSYSGPAGLKQLINACHEAGFAVILDVVYNHVGPEGNYLTDFAPYFTSAYHTPWGDAVNYDGRDSDGVRRFVIDNALYWLTEYHVDALRLDAIHGIFDFSARHILQELAEAFHAQAKKLGRQAYLIAESDLNDARIIRPRAVGGYGLDAQWSDDFHHSLHGVLTNDRHGYMEDFGSIADLAKAITEGFVYDGQYSTYRRRRFGNSSHDRPGEQFVVCIQNHDQIANLCAGRRLSQLVPFGSQQIAAALLLTAPSLPMLFMGEEYGEIAPFDYFTSFEDAALANAVREGRRKEMEDFLQPAEFHDPQERTTFENCRLNWNLHGSGAHAALLRFYRDLIALRKRSPNLSACRKDAARVSFDEGARWLVMERRGPSPEAIAVLCNFADRTQAVPLDSGNWKPVLWSWAPDYRNEPSHQPPLIQNGKEKPSIELPGQSVLICVSR